MSSLDADVNIRINAEDNASVPVDNSVKSIDRSFSQMRNSIRANERSFYLQHQSLYKFNMAMGTMRQVTGAGISVLNSLMLADIRATQSAKNLRDARRAAAESFASGDMKQYTKDLETIADIEEEIANNTKQQYLQWFSIGLHLTSTIIPAITKIRGLLGGGGASATPGFIGPVKPTNVNQGPVGGKGIAGKGTIGSSTAAAGILSIPAMIEAFGVQKNTVSPITGAPINVRSLDETLNEMQQEIDRKPDIIINLNGSDVGGVYS